MFFFFLHSPVNEAEAKSDVDSQLSKSPFSNFSSSCVYNLMSQKMLIKKEQLTLLENIGQGILHAYTYTLYSCVHDTLFLTHTGEFGIVYRGTLTPARRSMPKNEVAVKTLKGAIFYIVTNCV